MRSFFGKKHEVIGWIKILDTVVCYHTRNTQWTQYFNGSFMEKSHGVFIDFSSGFQVAPHHRIFMEVSWFNSVGTFHGLLLFCSENLVKSL